MAAVPQIEGLSVEDFLNFVKGKAKLLRHLPDESSWNHLDKKWICDVLFTLDEQGI